MHKLKVGRKELLLAVCSTLICLFTCDFVLRHVFPPSYKVTKYGWSVPVKTIEQTVVEDSPGKFRKVTVEYFENGFKRWGNIDTKKSKMLIIGDSFTQMNWVSNGEEWYSYLEEKFKNLELFVYGGGGYGTLQEYMILDDFIDKIQPQIILIQFYENDFMNNLYALDIQDDPANVFTFRPYLEDGKIVYRLPLPFLKLRRHSFIANRVLAIYDRFVSNGMKKDRKIYREKKRFEELNASKSEKERLQKLREKASVVTNEIYAMIRKKAGKTTPVYLLNLGDVPLVEKICRANNIVCISGAEKGLHSKEKEGFCVRIVNNDHWNKLGNKLVGQKLVEYFEKVDFDAVSKK